MKYSELISFKPIESTIQLLETADKKVAQDMVQTYVMSDSMAECLLEATVQEDPNILMYYDISLSHI